METLRLEVGKTYISREGKEVKIIKKSNPHNHPFQGSNGGFYAEDGRWGYGSEKRPEDLIEEVPESTRILEWVAVNIEYGCYTQDDIAEVIEQYLKYREGKK